MEREQNEMKAKRNGKYKQIHCENYTILRYEKLERNELETKQKFYAWKWNVSKAFDTIRA